MAHQQQIDFCSSVKKLYPKFFRNKLVVDIGSLDINGNNQSLFDNCLYIGVDLLPGKNVDIPTKGHELSLPDNSIDVIISTECFEHDLFYPHTIKNIIRMLKPGGLFIFSCATTGRIEHGTKKTTPSDAPFTHEFDQWGDYYQNLEESDIRDIVNIEQIFENFAFSTNQETHDLYFWGIKKGSFVDRTDYSFIIKKETDAENTKNIIRDIHNCLKQISIENSRFSSTESFFKSTLSDLREEIKEKSFQIQEHYREIKSIRKSLIEQKNKSIEFQNSLLIKEEIIEKNNQLISSLIHEKNQLINSNSWYITKPFRIISRLLRGEFFQLYTPGYKVFFKRFNNIIKMVHKHHNKFQFKKKTKKQPLKHHMIWGIITNEDTFLIAKSVSELLSFYDWKNEILLHNPNTFNHDFYIVIQPEMFSKHPPDEIKIDFHLECDLNSNLIVIDSLKKLEESLIILDHTLENNQGITVNSATSNHYLYFDHNVSKGFNFFKHMISNNKLRSYFRSIYHHLPVPLNVKWRIREIISPILINPKSTSMAKNVVMGFLSLLKNQNSRVQFNQINESGLEIALNQLAHHVQIHGPISHFFALPFFAVGGAERVISNFIKAIIENHQESSIVLMIVDKGTINDHSFPEKVMVIDFDKYIGETADLFHRQSFLHNLIQCVRPTVFHNINSEVAWKYIISQYPLSEFRMRIFACIFAFQFDFQMKEKIGFAAYFLRKAMPYLTGLISDNKRFIHDAISEYGFDACTQKKMHVIYQPSELIDSVLVRKENILKASRPQFLWAGRLDAEKRIDLFFDIVRQCPLCDFRVFGKVVVDNETSLPSFDNLTYEGPFQSPTQWLEKYDYEALIFTSKWEGLPNIIIEAGSLGIPVIAPTVGGIGELIHNDTGYPLPENPTVKDYIYAMQSVISEPIEAERRACNLKSLLRREHSWSQFVKAVSKIPNYFDGTNPPKSEPIFLNDANPVVSVIVPCYNQGHYLYECIESVLNGTRVTAEIIIIDDGSTDQKTAQYLSEVKVLSPERINIHKQKNSGLSCARNKGIELSKGKFIQFLDADDLLAPNKIDVQINHFITNSSIDVSISNFFICDEDRHIFSKPEEAIAHRGLVLNDFLYLWERGFAIPIHCALFRKTAIENIRFDIQAKAKEDWIFWTTLALKGTSMAYLNVHGSIYRQHNASMRRSYLKMGKAWLEAGLKIETMLEGRDPLFFESFVAWFDQCYRKNSAYNDEITSLKKAEIDTKTDLIDTIHYNECIKEINAEKLLEKLQLVCCHDSKPFFSVIVPIYNHYEHLEECLASISLQQSTIPIEIVCVEDASPDQRVTDLMLSLQGRLPKLKVVIHSTNKGISVSQNEAVQISSGEFIVFLDCDDALEPDALSSVRKVIQKKPDYDYFFSDRLDIDEKGKILRPAIYGGYPNIAFADQDNINNDLLDGMVASHLKVIRRSAYIDVEGCDDVYSGIQDWALALKMAEKYKFHYIQKYLYRHRIHNSSVTTTGRVSQFRKTNICRRFSLCNRFRSGSAQSNGLIEKKFSISHFDLKTIKAAWQSGHRCIALMDEPFEISSCNFIREYNSYFDEIQWVDPKLPCALYGYLWSHQILRKKQNCNS